MSKVIIWMQDNGILAVTHPADCGLSLEEIAKKDLPSGKKFKIMDAEELPAWDEFRDAWEIDEEELTDGVAD
ncbi:MAG: hypothetical protein Unbinned834contig1000_32 [Prokaryotic dsDNA virus sp.]|nr:MAG: hypothetical protein Unbinned834contig1000_32 [Prokaryotic dsDNA virus sp.]|tara:strand:- start:76 stop:291 length:216 start_codon:yes stop_codon:yes gene_type:complete